MSTGISFSNMSALHRCGQFYKLSVLEKVVQPLNVNFEFGRAIHAGVHAALEGLEGHEIFSVYWDSLANKGLVYERFNHEQLKDLGEMLIATFQKKYAPKMKLIVGEERFSTMLYGVKLEGTPDALVEWEGQKVLLDFKTGAYNYPIEKTAISTQLHLYATLLVAAGYPVDSLAYIVFNKGTGCIQTPHVIPFSKNTAKELITEAVTYFLRNKNSFEKNRNSCIMGKQICPYLERCGGTNE